MAKIHWIVYVLIGLFVAISSYLIDYKKLVFFFFTGWVFVCVGIAKSAINAGENKNEKMQMPHQRAHQYKHCPKCRNILRINDRFCGKCGASV